MSATLFSVVVSLHFFHSKNWTNPFFPLCIIKIVAKACHPLKKITIVCAVVSYALFGMMEL
jgi:hypothetical protein